MSTLRRHWPLLLVSVLVLAMGIVNVAGAFTTTEKATITALRARITALETLTTELDAGLLDHLDALGQLNEMILDQGDRIDAIVPPIAITGIHPILDCDGTNCTVSVEWFSDPPATGQVEWGDTPALGTMTPKETDLLPYHRQRIGVFPQDDTARHFRILATTPGATETAPITGFVTA